MIPGVNQGPQGVPNPNAPGFLQDEIKSALRGLGERPEWHFEGEEEEIPFNAKQAEVFLKEMERERKKSEDKAIIRNLSISQLREQMTCPLSYELFKDPVTEREGVCAGHTFERMWIDTWVRSNRDCPLARTHLLATDLISNKLVREACRLLDPERVGPLDEDDMEAIYLGADALLQRRSPHEEPPRVPQDIHDVIFKEIENFKEEEVFEDDVIRWNINFIEWKNIAKIAGFVVFFFGFLTFKRYFLGKGCEDKGC